MSVWADNLKFVKDIIDSKLAKIDHAIHEVNHIYSNELQCPYEKPISNVKMDLCIQYNLNGFFRKFKRQIGVENIKF